MGRSRDKMAEIIDRFGAAPSPEQLAALDANEIDRLLGNAESMARWLGHVISVLRQEQSKRE